MEKIIICSKVDHSPSESTLSQRRTGTFAAAVPSESASFSTVPRLAALCND